MFIQNSMFSFRQINMSNISVSANLLLSAIHMGKTLHEIVNWPLVIKQLTVQIRLASTACGFSVMCLTAMEIDNLSIQPKKKPLSLV